MSPEIRFTTEVENPWKILSLGSRRDQLEAFNGLVRSLAQQLFKDVPADERRKLDALLCNNILRALPRNAVVSAYLAHENDCEPSVQGVIDAMVEQQDFVVCLPRYAPDTKEKVMFDRVMPAMRHLCEEMILVSWNSRKGLRKQSPPPDLEFWGVTYFWSPVMQTEKQYPLDVIIRPLGIDRNEQE